MTKKKKKQQKKGDQKKREWNMTKNITMTIYFGLGILILLTMYLILLGILKMPVW